MRKLFTIAATLFAGISMYAALPLTALSNGTTAFTEEFWGETKTKNTVIYNQSNQFMMLSQGNALSFANDLMYIGNSSKQSAFVFYISEAADINVVLGYNNSDATVSLYYMGETVEELSSGNVGATGEKTCGTAAITSGFEGGITAKNCAAGYYKVHGTLRFAAKSITLSAPSSADHTKATLISIKLDDAPLAGFSANQQAYEVGYEFDVTDAPVVTAETADDATVQITQATGVPGTATVVCTSYDESETITYTIQFTKETLVPIIRAKHTGATTADVKGSIGGTVDKNTQAAGKLGSNGHYFGIQLAEGNFQAGDSLVIVATLNGGNIATLYTESEGTNLIDTVPFDATTGIASYVLKAEASAIYIVRLTSDCNPTVSMMQVYRTGTAPSNPTAVINTLTEKKAIKRIVNGQLIIERDGHSYNALGAEIK